MRVIDWTLLVFAGAVIGLGAAADRANAQVSCNNSCRMKMSHYYPPSGPCVRFALSTCLNCSPGLNVLCSGSSISGNCKGPFHDIFVSYHESCPLVCQPAGAAAVEANDLGIGDNPVSIPRYICEGITGEDPPIDP
jgi:hypothetical protein